jgi:hypothetical protein
MSTAFRRLLPDLELTELHLNGRLYTWSNEQSHPTLTRIDRTFVSSDWLDLYPHHRLKAMSTACSDHAPMLPLSNVDSPVFRRFKFEAIWPCFPGFLEAVHEGWNLTLQNADACRILDYKLRDTAKALKRWSQRFVGSVRLQLAVAREVIFKLEQAHAFPGRVAPSPGTQGQVPWVGLPCSGDCAPESCTCPKAMRTRSFFICKHVAGIGRPWLRS